VKPRLYDIAPIVSVVFALLVLTWAGVLTFTENAKETEIERSFLKSQQTSLQFAEQVARTIDSVQSTIDFAAYSISRSHSAAELKVVADAGALGAKPVLQVTFVDAEGFTVATNAGLDSGRTDLRDREHIRVHLEGSVDGLYIGAPVLGRVSGKWSIQLTRKVHDDAGQFIGIIVASVDPFYFQRFWSVTMGTDRLVSLLRTDGAILTRSFALDWVLGSRIRRKDLMEAIGEREMGRLVLNSSEGNERLSYFVRVPGYPLYVVSGEITSHVVASYGAIQKRYYLIGAVMSVVLLILGLWLASFAGRLRREEQVARRAEEAQSAFLAAMSHELRTPLNALIGFVGLITKTKLDDEQQTYVRTMQHSARTLANIVTDVLDFSKLESGAFLIEKGPCDIHECLSQIETVTRLLVEDKPILVRMERSRELPEVIIADGSRLYQSLLNLCGNAAKFTQSGQILISAKIVERQSREHLVVDVSDTGPGIDKTVVTKLFTPFEQGEAAGKLRAAGTGLGLAITKMLLNLMGGTISVASVPGSGSTFTLEVPFERHVERRDEIGPSSDFSVAAPLRVLIADDARSSRMLLRILLQKKGHSVVEAEDGVQALELLRTQDFDVAFLDIQMPRLDGLSVARQVTEWAGARRRPVIVGLSAMARPEDVENAKEAGISNYLTKPMHETQLDRVLLLAGKGVLTGA
jgi:two-component system sensor histidine kinase BarA